MFSHTPAPLQTHTVLHPLMFLIITSIGTSPPGFSFTVVLGRSHLVLPGRFGSTIHGVILSRSPRNLSPLMLLPSLVEEALGLSQGIKPFVKLFDWPNCYSKSCCRSGFSLKFWFLDFKISPNGVNKADLFVALNVGRQDACPFGPPSLRQYCYNPSVFFTPFPNHLKISTTLGDVL